MKATPLNRDAVERGKNTCKKRVLSIYSPECMDTSMPECGPVRKPGWGSGETELNGDRGTMAAGPGVSMQCGSPARELSLSVQQVANQTHGDRTKPEEATGKNVIYALVLCLIYGLLCEAG